MEHVIQITAYFLVGFISIIFIIYFTKSNPKRICGRHVVITGGSKGIGLCIALECTRMGAHVTVIARDANILEKTRKLLNENRKHPEQIIQVCSLDISIGYEEVEHVLSKSEVESGPIYMLVNCAGFAICGVLEEIPVEDSRKLMNVNYFGTYYCTRYVLPKMKSAGKGIIVVTSSQAALLGIYGYGAYAASKFALRGMAETIAMESKRHGVSVTLALPADTNTPGFESEEKTKPKETKMISGSGGLASAAEVAKSILNDALNERFISVMGIESWFLTILGGGLFPWKGTIKNILHAFILGPLRIAGFFLHLYFEYIINKCEREKC